MKEQARLNHRKKTKRALEESYEKMLCQKVKSGESIVTVDAQGEPLMMSAEEAWERYKADK